MQLHAASDGESKHAHDYIRVYDIIICRPWKCQSPSRHRTHESCKAAHSTPLSEKIGGWRGGINSTAKRKILLKQMICVTKELFSWHPCSPLQGGSLQVTDPTNQYPCSFCVAKLYHFSGTQCTVPSKVLIPCRANNT